MERLDSMNETYLQPLENFNVKIHAELDNLNNVTDKCVISISEYLENFVADLQLRPDIELCFLN